MSRYVLLSFFGSIDSRNRARSTKTIAHFHYRIGQMESRIHTDTRTASNDVAIEAGPLCVTRITNRITQLE